MNCTSIPVKTLLAAALTACLSVNAEAAGGFLSGLLDSVETVEKSDDTEQKKVDQDSKSLINFGHRKKDKKDRKKRKEKESKSADDETYDDETYDVEKDDELEDLSNDAFKEDCATEEDLEFGVFVDIGMDGLARRLKSGKKILLVDVRTPNEYASGHIEGAINVPVEKIGSFKADKTGEVYLYCKSGMRSTRACQNLVDRGYKRVFNCGGINSWTGPLVNGK